MTTSHKQMISFGRLALALSLLFSACDSGESGAPWDGENEGGGLDPGVGQGGAQDFGHFRKILEAGEVPAPETLDDVGFFNEHKIELPKADCGASICAHALLGTMDNMIDESNCTMVFVAFNTPIKPSELERPPTHLIMAIDSSGSMGGEKMEYARSGLLHMLEGLDPHDRVTIVPFSDAAEVTAHELSPESQALWDAIADIDADGETNIYDGLRQSYELAESSELPSEYQHRVVLLSDGAATSGVEQEDRMLRLAAAYSGLGYTLSTIGMGEDFNPTLVRGLAEKGQGAFYFAENPSAVREIFVDEAAAFLIPLGENANVQVSSGDRYFLREVYGSKLVQHDGVGASLHFPRLQMAQRQSTHPDSGGRRGGGGAVIVELIPKGDRTPDVASLSFDYQDLQSGKRVSQQVELVVPGDRLDREFFTDTSVEKGFVMLNIYVGLKMAAERAARGEIPGAYAILAALHPNVEAWIGDNPDGDIESDLYYVDLFMDVLLDKYPDSISPELLPPAEDPWPAD